MVFNSCRFSQVSKIDFFPSIETFFAATMTIFCNKSIGFVKFMSSFTLSFLSPDFWNISSKPSFFRIHIFTCLANPLPFCFFCIQLVKRMAIFTMGFLSMKRAKSIASHYIFNKRNWLKMLRVYAVPNFAKMIEGKPGRNLSFDQFIGNTMCADSLAPESKSSIFTSFFYVSSPQPAGFSFKNLIPKSIHFGRLHGLE